MCFTEVLFIKLKVKGYLRNLTENTEELIDTKVIKKSNTISYIIDNTKHTLIIDNQKITLIRENNEFSHAMIFKNHNTTTSEYYLKESSYSLEFNIKTTKLIIEDNKIDITYKIIESDNIYNYILEVSDNL